MPTVRDALDPAEPQKAAPMAWLGCPRSRAHAPAGPVVGDHDGAPGR